MKMDMSAVTEQHRARTDRIVQASAHVLASAQNFEDELYIEALALALLELADIWREEARKVMDENRRGCKGTAESLRDCAGRVSGVAIAIRQHGLPQAASTEPETNWPKENAERETRGLAPIPEGLPIPERDVDITRAGAVLAPMFATPGITTGATTAEEARALRLDPVTEFLTDVGNDKATEMYDQVRGATEVVIDERLAETLNGAAAAIIAQVREAEQIDPGQVKIIKQGRTDLEIEVPMTQDQAQSLFGLTVSVADPVPGWASQPQVPVFELTDDPATWQAVPDHTSVSQVQLMGECGMKYWLRYRRGAPDRPSWAMVGGSALHGCIEEIEKAFATRPDEMHILEHVPELWKLQFTAQIQRTAAENPLFPIETWHASKSGKEDRAWWDADGPEMVHRYLEWRAKWVAEGWELIRDAQGPIVEREFLIFAGGGPVKGFIDSAWYHPMRQQVAIIDAKSGASAPPDYFQPATYATALKQMLGATVQPFGWLGGYWDARKGQLTGPLVDLSARHPQAEIEHRFSTLNRMNQAQIYMPNTNSAYGGCGSCSLKRSCPVGSRMNTGTVG